MKNGHLKKDIKLIFYAKKRRPISGFVFVKKLRVLEEKIILESMFFKVCFSKYVFQSMSFRVCLSKVNFSSRTWSLFVKIRCF